MKKILVFLNASALIVFAVILPYLISSQPRASSAGRYVGYSWQGEAQGVELEDATSYIETIIELDENDIIVDAKMNFFVKQDGFWIMRQSGNASVSVDFSQEPTPAVPGSEYKAGNSMFSICTADLMSFYAVAVNPSGVAAVAFVDPVTRYQFEMKFPADFDFSRPFGDLTVGSGLIVPTIRTSGSGIVQPEDWEAFSDKTLLNMEVYSFVIDRRGILEGLTESSTAQEFLERLGVVFSNSQPQEMPVEYGYFGIGGWHGNYRAIEQSLIGVNAREKTSLVDWSDPRFSGAVNEQNIFGIDVQTGATRTVQNGFDGISGATIRISRESTSYQRALVAAGILSKGDVIIGRF